MARLAAATTCTRTAWSRWMPTRGASAGTSSSRRATSEYDWEAVQIPLLVDTTFRGERRQLLLWANRNAFYYVLARQTGRFLLAREFARQTWAEGIDSTGRPIPRPGGSPPP